MEMSYAADDASQKIWEKLIERERKYEKEQRLLRKRTEDYDTLEEVFDKPTLMCLYKMLNEGVIKNFHGIIASGKEARIYGGEDPLGNRLAIKIYLTSTVEFRKTRMKYMVGDPRFPSPTRFKDTRKIISLWASKEFKNLKKAYEVGVNVPEPIYWRENIVIMKFIGRNFTPAPTLKDLKQVTKTIYKKVLTEVEKLYRLAELVHADLSEYNIFYHDKKTILFDFAQGVLKMHPMAEKFLLRDLSNINEFFLRRGVEVLDINRLLRKLIGHESW